MVGRLSKRIDQGLPNVERYTASGGFKNSHQSVLTLISIPRSKFGYNNSVALLTANEI